MRRFLSFLLLGLFTASLFGCVTRGKDFSSDLSWIKIKETSQSDVASILGQPYKVGNSGGTATWTYSFYNMRLFGESHTKDLKFYWTPDKKVQDFSFTSSFPTDKRQSLYLQQKEGTTRAQ